MLSTRNGSIRSWCPDAVGQSIVNVSRADRINFSTIRDMMRSLTLWLYRGVGQRVVTADAQERSRSRRTWSRDDSGQSTLRACGNARRRIECGPGNSSSRVFSTQVGVSRPHFPATRYHETLAGKHQTCTPSYRRRCMTNLQLSTAARLRNS